jgi:CYTH domain-containing protein
MKKLMSLSLLGILMISVIGVANFATATDIPSANEGNTNRWENQKRFNGTIQGNETNQFQFQNQFRFQVRTNVSIEIGIECDSVNVQEKTMEMDLNTSENTKLRVRINNSNYELGLQNGILVQTESQTQYRFMEGVVFNFTTNNSESLQAQLRYQTAEQNSTWAYYNETQGKFITVQSRYENGYLIANTDHFSIRTVLSAQPKDPKRWENQNKYNRTIQGNETNQFQFQNQFEFQLLTNNTMEIDIECDSDNVQAKNMEMKFNSSENTKLQVRINNSNSELGLQNGSLVQTQSQTQYRFMEGVVFNFTTNNSDPLQAQLRYQTTEQNSTWAYYNETQGKFITVKSRYENGYILADTDHFSMWTVLSAQQGPKRWENQNKYTGSVQGNETNQFQFQNQFEFQLQTNSSVEIDIGCDSDNVQAKNMEMKLNTSENTKLQVRINNSNSELGLQNGSMVQTQNQNQYKFMEGVVFNFTTNSSDPLQAQIRYQMTEQNCTWAYYDETQGKFITVQSRYENGYLVADTDHFSIWTILTPIESEISDPSDPSDTSNIAGFTMIGPLGVLGVCLLGYFTKKRNTMG